MAEKKFNYIYGLVSSWRLGISLGIDPISQKEKICTFDCSYCQLGRTRLFGSGKMVFVAAEKIIEEIKSLPLLKIDYITLSGRGEPTLAKNLGDIIEKIRKIRPEKIAVITNSSMICKKDVQEALAKADLVMLKLDAHSEDLFRKINKPIKGLTLHEIIKGIRDFRSIYKGKLALQIMFVKDNKNYAEKLANLAKEIQPDEVQLNTPLRLCKESPLTKKEMDAIKKYFKGFDVISVYDVEKKKASPLEKVGTLKRRGKE